MISSSVQKIAIIVAGGSGTRMGNQIPKQFLELCGKPVLYHTIEAFRSAFPDVRLVLVIPAAHKSFIAPLLVSFERPPSLHIVEGGDTRFHSVQQGLEYAKLHFQLQDTDILFVHDGVRPLVSTKLIEQSLLQAQLHAAVIPVVDLKDSLRTIPESRASGHSKAVDRSQFKAVQTPQTFQAQVIFKAFEQAYDPSFTDEATVVERMGHPVFQIPGEDQNIKITKPFDLVIAKAFLQQD